MAEQPEGEPTSPATGDPEVDAVLVDLDRMALDAPPVEVLHALSDAHDRLVARLSAAQS